MGNSQRTKGAVYEREVRKVFSLALGRRFDRNIGQARDGGNDLDVGPLVVECKRRKTLTVIAQWYAQAKAAAARRTGWTVPIVVGREDNGESLVVLTLTDFLALTSDALRRHLPPEV